MTIADAADILLLHLSALVAQLVEHVLGKDEVTSSILVEGSSLGFNKKTGLMREIIHFQCTECQRINYSGMKDKKKKPERIELKKYCPFCRKHAPHKEMKK